MLLLDGEFTASEIKDMVTTPGEPLSRESTSWRTGKLRTALINAVVAATKKCTDIGYSWNNENR